MKILIAFHDTPTRFWCGCFVHSFNQTQFITHPKKEISTITHRAPRQSLRHSMHQLLRYSELKAINGSFNSDACKWLQNTAHVQVQGMNNIWLEWWLCQNTIHFFKKSSKFNSTTKLKTLFRAPTPVSYGWAMLAQSVAMGDYKPRAWSQHAYDAKQHGNENKQTGRRYPRYPRYLRYPR